MENSREEIGLSEQERKYLNLYFSSRGYWERNNRNRFKVFLEDIKLFIRRIVS